MKILTKLTRTISLKCRTFSMVTYVFSMQHYFQVFQFVVSSDIINMMNMFKNLKFPTKVFFHQVTMFKNVLAINSKSDISIGINVSTTFPSWVLFSSKTLISKFSTAKIRTKLRLIPPFIFRGLNFFVLTTVFTIERNMFHNQIIYDGGGVVN